MWEVKREKEANSDDSTSSFVLSASLLCRGKGHHSWVSGVMFLTGGDIADTVEFLSCGHDGMFLFWRWPLEPRKPTESKTSIGGKALIQPDPQLPTSFPGISSGAKGLERNGSFQVENFLPLSLNASEAVTTGKDARDLAFGPRSSVPMHSPECSGRLTDEPFTDISVLALPGRSSTFNFTLCSHRGRILIYQYDPK